MAPNLLEWAFVHDNREKVKHKRGEKDENGRPRASPVWPFSRAKNDEKDIARPRAVTKDNMCTENELPGDASLDGKLAQVLEFQSVVGALETCGQEFRECLIRLRIAPKPVVEHLERARGSNDALAHFLSSFTSQLGTWSNQLDAAHSEIEELLQLVQHALAECAVVCSSSLRSQDACSQKCICDQQVQELSLHVASPVSSDEKSRLLKEKVMADRIFAQRSSEFGQIASEFLDRCWADFGEMMSHFFCSHGKLVGCTGALNGYPDLAERFASFSVSDHVDELVGERSSVVESEGMETLVSCAAARCALESSALLMAPRDTIPEKAPSGTVLVTPTRSVPLRPPTGTLPTLLGRPKCQSSAATLEMGATKAIMSVGSSDVEHVPTGSTKDCSNPGRRSPATATAAVTSLARDRAYGEQAYRTRPSSVSRVARTQPLFGNSFA